MPRSNFFLLLVLTCLHGCAGVRYDAFEQSGSPTAYGKLPYFLHDVMAPSAGVLPKDEAAKDYLMEKGWRNQKITMLDDLQAAWGNPQHIEYHGSTSTYVYKKQGWVLRGLWVYPVIPIPIPIIPIPSRLPDTHVDVEDGKVKWVYSYSLKRSFAGCMLTMPKPSCGIIDLDAVEY